MFAPIGNRVAKATSTRMNRLLTAPLEGAVGDASARRHASAVLVDIGVELKEELRIRPDGRAVFLVRHPEWGRCVLKTTCPVRSARAGWANMKIAEFVGECDTPIFPAVHLARPDYTLEEYIPGISLRGWMKSSGFRLEPLREFLTEFKRWGAGAGPWIAGGALEPREIRAIISGSIGKCLAQGAYFTPARRMKAQFNLLRSRRDLMQDIAWLERKAEDIEIPRGRMCGDFSNVNLIFDDRENRVVIVDYELMSPGHIGFDCSYLLTSLAKIPDCSRAVDDLDSIVNSSDFYDSEDLAEFFSVYSRVLTRISRTVYEERGVSHRSRFPDRKSVGYDVLQGT